MWKKYILHLKVFYISQRNFRKDLDPYCNGKWVFWFLHGILQHPNLRTMYCTSFQFEHHSENSDYRAPVSTSRTNENLTALVQRVQLVFKHIPMEWLQQGLSDSRWMVSYFVVIEHRTTCQQTPAFCFWSPCVENKRYHNTVLYWWWHF